MQKSQKQLKKKEQKPTIVKEQPKQKDQKGQIQKQKQQTKPEQKKESVQQKQFKKDKQEIIKKEQPIINAKRLNEIVQVVLDEKLLMPSNQNITISKSLQISKLSSMKLHNMIKSLMSQQSQIFVHPIFIQSSNKQDIIMIYSVEGMKKYKDIQLHLQDQIIFRWLIQILYLLHPSNFWKDVAYPKITKNNLFLVESPILEMSILREEKYFWQNPIKVLITEEVKDQKQYIQQMLDFNEEFKKIKSFQDIEQLYYKITIGEQLSQFISTRNIANKLKLSLPSQTINNNIESQNLLSAENNKWLAKQVGMNQKQSFELCFKGSSTGFNPQKFWPKLKQQIKTENSPGLILLKIQTISGQNKQIGFFSTLFAINTSMSSNLFSEYVEDKQKRSLLINFDQRTFHHLKDQKFAFTFNKQLLLCIGKCDIVLSAFNITNLCYFPTSFEPDLEGTCTNADILCGGKKFKLQQIEVYALRTKVQ